MMDSIDDLRGIFGNVLHHAIVGDTQFIVVQLQYHVALYVNPTKDYGYDDRYCMHSLGIAALAISHFEKTGEICFWQKHHNKNISIKGTHAYRSGELQIPEYAIAEVSWDACKIREMGVYAYIRHHYQQPNK